MNYLSFNLKDISNYRSELMGWSILWIMMLHFTFHQIKPFGFIAQYGFAGVDIFLFVSGFGLFFSLEKTDKLIIFYRKRLLRIFPTYYFIGAFTNIIITHDDILTFLFRYSTIGFWICREYAEWFIPSIIMLYILAPLMKKLIDKKRFIIICIFIICIYIISFYFTNKNHIIDRSHYFFIYRIPAFVFGMICTFWIKNNISQKFFFLIMFIGLPIFIYLYPFHHQIYNYKYLSIAFLLPLFVYIFILLSRNFRCLSPILRKMGNASLEIYLTQGIFFSLVLNGTIAKNSDWHDILSVLMIITSTFLGIIIHWLIDKSKILNMI